LAPETVHALRSYQWPGNIRELENAIHHALLVCAGTRVRPGDLRLPAPRSDRRPETAPDTDATKGLEEVLMALFEGNQPNLYQRIDETVFRVAYEYCERNQLRTARLLGISRNIVRDRLFRYRLVDPQSR
jgi:sigma-54-specific transcriptional regulator